MIHHRQVGGITSAEWEHAMAQIPVKVVMSDKDPHTRAA
jgi:hypothetical protein